MNRADIVQYIADLTPDERHALWRDAFEHYHKQAPLAVGDIVEMDIPATEAYENSDGRPPLSFRHLHGQRHKIEKVRDDGYYSIVELSGRHIWGKAPRHCLIKVS